MYSCREDRAITFSNWLFEGVRRLGTLVPGDFITAKPDSLDEVNPNIHLVEVKGGAGFLSHGYFHENPAASSDLILLLRENCDPDPRGVRPLQPATGRFWSLGPDYPMPLTAPERK